MTGHDSSAPMNDHGAAVTHSHEVAFYADDSSVVDGYARFIESSLKGGNAVIVVVTESHRASLIPRLEADGSWLRPSNKGVIFRWTPPMLCRD